MGRGVTEGPWGREEWWGGALEWLEWVGPIDWRWWVREKGGWLMARRMGGGRDRRTDDASRGFRYRCDCTSLDPDNPLRRRGF